MGDTGVNGLLDMIDNNGVNGEVVVVVEGMEIEDEAVMVHTETGTTVYRNFSCQTDFTTHIGASIPVLFCGLFSPSCDAETQCDIPPLKVNVSVCTYGSKKVDSAIRCATEKIRKYPLASPVEPKESVKEKTDLQQQTIEEVIRKVPAVDGNDSDISLFNSDTDTCILFNSDTDIKEMAECAAAVSTQYTQHSHLKQRKRKKPHKVDDFNWGIDAGSCDEAKKKPRKRTKKRKAEEKFTGVVFDPRKGSSKKKDISETCDKNSPTENSDRALVPFKYREKTGKNSELGTRDVIVSKEEDQTEECYSDWITDDEVDDDESDSGKPAFNQGNRTCSHCTLTFNSPLLLLEHLEGNHAAHVCSICGFTTTFKHRLKKHMVKHSKERAFVCDICGKQYSQKQYLRGHISRAHSDYDHGNRYPFSCQHCKRLYHSEANLIRHQKQESGPCEVCGVMLKCSGLFCHHKRDHFSQGENCKKGFQSRNTLLLHKSPAHKKKTIQCPICPKKFAFQSYLNTHLANAHKEGSLQYKCPDCSFCTRSKSYLTSHQSRMHKHPLKFYSCGFCKKDFRSNSRLVEHTRIHTGERPFSCPVCCKTFYSQSNLYAHERSVHNRLTNYGSRDTESRQDAATMRRKISSCYECHLCDSTFPTLKKLKYHLFRDHKIDNDAKKGDNVEQERVVEMNEAGMVPVQMEANTKDLLPEDFEPTVKENDTINVIPPSDEGVVSRVTLPMPAYVVPPNVNFVEIDGVQYHVVRSNQ
ncbi:zinc finger protein 62 homolog [Homarus americanus]|uniref:zinc finger protein 62 homolog n=1 Tax=Homarus americanus TaxID=6706 RepID=UPI001C475C85|nr:zinc finger protein 62 homolog [Homarus americanus]XP_042212611.1 zinc finger protein 62 homolog [Homarus americanus]XP_042212612.1 zinc finger protein 62 homolog [Homarus americanus]